MTVPSVTPALNESIRSRRSRVLNLGFGQVGLPVLPEIEHALTGSAHRNDYGPVSGGGAVRDAAAWYLTSRGLETAASQVVLGPGSKALLFAVLAALPGDVVLPRPSWVSYAAQAGLTGKRVLWVDVPGNTGGVPDPGNLERGLAAAHQAGIFPRILVLTLPDNPTGSLAPSSLIKHVCEIAREHDLVIVSDEIYRDLSYEDLVYSPALELPEQTVVTGGLSKAAALGGYRIGYARLPDGPLRTKVLGIASEVWSSVPGPMEAVAEYVFADHAEVRDYVDAARRLHHAVVDAVHAGLVAAGASCRTPQGGFFLYPDFEPVRPVLAAQGIETGARLADVLLERYGIGVLAGAAFGDDPRALRFRAATGLLYGSSAEQQWSALYGDDPLNLPWIADSLAHIRESLQDLVHPEGVA
ncbi:pyridoxal phosphate-dependent aminotransferase [Amycolatopsis sp. NPDC049868]|uniref:pyridoxal phosphate-dependent aminotransferase n=1 Tax=Amycolatopsis sp. NPDC049868 TaxID=3363934 RepID=UPI0037959AA9